MTTTTRKNMNQIKWTPCEHEQYFMRPKSAMWASKGRNSESMAKEPTFGRDRTHNMKWQGTKQGKQDIYGQNPTWEIQQQNIWKATRYDNDTKKNNEITTIKEIRYMRSGTYTQNRDPQRHAQ